MFQICCLFLKETIGHKKKPIRDEPELALHKTIVYTTFPDCWIFNKINRLVKQGRGVV